jgi:hypothetical protein
MLALACNKPLENQSVRKLSWNPATPTIYTEPTGYISQGVTRFLLHAPVPFSADRVFKQFTNLY